MGMMQGENKGIAVSIGLLLLGVFTLFGVQIAAQPLATAIVEATRAKNVIDLGFIVSFLSFFPMLMLLGGIAAMFTGTYAESRRHDEGEGTAALMRAIIVVIGVLMLPMLIITLVNVSVVYGENICGTTDANHIVVNANCIDSAPADVAAGAALAANASERTDANAFNAYLYGSLPDVPGDAIANNTQDATNTLRNAYNAAKNAIYGSAAGSAVIALSSMKFTAINTFAGLLPLGYIVALINLAIPQIGSRVAGYVRGG